MQGEREEIVEFEQAASLKDLFSVVLRKWKWPNKTKDTLSSIAYEQIYPNGNRDRDSDHSDDYKPNAHDDDNYDLKITMMTITMTITMMMITKMSINLQSEMEPIEQAASYHLLTIVLTVFRKWKSSNETNHLPSSYDYHEQIYPNGNYDDEFYNDDDDYYNDN